MVVKEIYQGTEPAKGWRETATAKKLQSESLCKKRDLKTENAIRKTTFALQ